MMAIGQDKIREFWDQLAPSHKRVAVIVGGIAAMFVVVSLVNKGDEAISTKDEAIQRTSKTVLAETNTRSLGIDALNAELRRVNQELSTSHAEMSKMQKQLTEISRRRGNDPDITREMNIVKGQLQGLTNTARQLGWDVEDIKTGYLVPPMIEQAAPAPTPSATDAKTKVADADDTDDTDDTDDHQDESDLIKQSRRLPGDASYYFRAPPVRPVNTDPSKSGQPELAIITIEDSAKKEDQERAEDSVPLPTGTILSGVTINGLRVPTGMNGRKDPFPLLVRLQHEAILPNGFRVDLRECFATLSGYAELATEKIMLRGEQLSCMTQDDHFIDLALPGFINGEDGQAGLSGELVTRSGSLIARTAVAGFLSGFGEAFDTSRVPTLNTGNVGNEAIFQRNFSSGAAQHGAASGLSSSMEMISEYYMKLADQMFPVIEINAGRQVDIILVKGIRLKKQAIKNNSSSTRKVSKR